MSRDVAGKLVLFFWNLQCSRKIETGSKAGVNPLTARTVACPERHWDSGGPTRGLVGFPLVLCSPLVSWLTYLEVSLSARHPSCLEHRVTADPTRVASKLSEFGRMFPKDHENST